MWLLPSVAAEGQSEAYHGHPPMVCPQQAGIPLSAKRHCKVGDIPGSAVGEGLAIGLIPLCQVDAGADEPAAFHRNLAQHQLRRILLLEFEQDDNHAHPNQCDHAGAVIRVLHLLVAGEVAGWTVQGEFRLAGLPGLPGLF